jgi:hypothetical protein
VELSSTFHFFFFFYWFFRGQQGTCSICSWYECLPKSK